MQSGFQQGDAFGQGLLCRLNSTSPKQVVTKKEFVMKKTAGKMVQGLVVSAALCGAWIGHNASAQGVVQTRELSPAAPNDNTPSPEQWKAIGKTFTFEGHNVFYVDQGSGTAIVALHGYPTSSWDFRRIAAPMAQNARFIAPDLLGFGYSAKPADYAYSIGKHADLVVALTRQLALTKVRLIGSDIGNAVVQELLARERETKLPFTIESVVLINGSLFAEQFQPTSTQKALLSPMGGMVNRAASQNTFVGGLSQTTGPEKRISSGDWVAAWSLLNYPNDSRLAHKILPTVAERESNDARWTDALCRSAVPLKMIVGKADPTGGKEMLVATAQKCGSGRNVSGLEIEKSGHFPHLEYPAETTNAILTWRAGGY
jgi:pimeloyl-ACP methyl ester carboxylesterase